jgi:cytidine deaminase
VVGKIGPDENKVTFEPFVGVAPRRYVEFFAWSRRKSQVDGKLLKWDPQTARPRFSDKDPPELRQGQPAYRTREYLIMGLLSRVQLKSGLTVRSAQTPVIHKQDQPQAVTKPRTPRKAVESSQRQKTDNTQDAK